MKIKASRLSEGNKIFPAEIDIEETGLTVKIPGFFKNRSQFLDYKQIGDVSVDTPLVGYSTITFYTQGARVSAHGFTKSEVRRIKNAIENGKNNRHGDEESNDRFVNRKEGKKIHQRDIDEITEEMHKEWEEEEHDRLMRKERNKQLKLIEEENLYKESIKQSENYNITKTPEQLLEELKLKEIEFAKPWMFDQNFENGRNIMKIIFPNEFDDICKTLERIFNVCKEILYDIIENGENEERKELYSFCIEKIKEGISKLSRYELTNEQNNKCLTEFKKTAMDMDDKYSKVIDEFDNDEYYKFLKKCNSIEYFDLDPQDPQVIELQILTISKKGNVLKIKFNNGIIQNFNEGKFSISDNSDTYFYKVNYKEQYNFYQ